MPWVQGLPDPCPQTTAGVAERAAGRQTAHGIRWGRPDHRLAPADAPEGPFITGHPSGAEATHRLERATPTSGVSINPIFYLSITKGPPTRRCAPPAGEHGAATVV